MASLTTVLAAVFGFFVLSTVVFIPFVGVEVRPVKEKFYPMKTLNAYAAANLAKKKSHLTEVQNEANDYNQLMEKVNTTKALSRELQQPTTLAITEALNTQLKRRPANSSTSKVIFYNRVGKCGSRSLNNVIEKLSLINKFSYSYSLEYEDKEPSRGDIELEMKKISSLRGPVFYHRHIYFLDFEKSGYQRPIYINLIRDPIERFISLYNFIKYGGLYKTTDKGVPEPFKVKITDCLSKKTGPCSAAAMFKTGRYLCGQEKKCYFPSNESVALAKKRIDEDYLFIGITEEFENSLKLFEKVLPHYFTGAVKIWNQSLDLKKKTSSYKHEDLSEEWRDHLRTGHMWHEYEVYHHAKKKFEDMKSKYGVV